MNNTQSPLDVEPLYSQVKGLVEQGETNASIVQKLNGDVSEASIRRFRKRHGLSPKSRSAEYVKLNGEEAEISVNGPPESYVTLDDPDEMLRERGLDPKDWTLTSVVANRWMEHTQTKFTAQRKRPELELVAARSEGWVKPKSIRNISGGGNTLVVFLGDQQAPFHDEHLHELTCQWLEGNQPHEGVLLGDTVDYPDVSRHRKTPSVMARINECNQAGYELLRDYVSSSLSTDWTKLVGNHDWRLHLFVIDQAPSLHGLTRVATDDDPDPQEVLSVDYLLRLDELGIEYVHPPFENWELGQFNISEKLAARHGWIVTPGSGKSALATLGHLGYSVVVGHTHRQSKVYKTTHDINNDPSTLTAVEAGCMCRLDLGYAVKPDWQQGFATATIYPDGKFNVDLATYVNGVLMWRDQRYE